jgi:hypothetical protein
MLENPESLFADSLRTQKGSGISLYGRITGNFLSRGPETQTGRVISFCGRITGNFSSRVPESQTGRGIFLRENHR